MLCYHFYVIIFMLSFYHLLPFIFPENNMTHSLQSLNKKIQVPQFGLKKMIRKKQTIVSSACEVYF